jgi:hypothetical protein
MRPESEVTLMIQPLLRVRICRGQERRRSITAQEIEHRSHARAQVLRQPRARQRAIPLGRVVGRRPARRQYEQPNLDRLTQQRRSLQPTLTA